MRRIVKVFLTMLLLVGASQASAFEGGLFKGDFEINGRLAFSHNNVSYDGDSRGSTSDLELSTFMGVFVSDLIQLGGTLFVANSSVDPDNGDSYSGTMFGIGPDIVFNFNNEGPIVPFIDFAVAIAMYSGDIYGEETGYILPSLQVGIRALIGNSAAANFGIGYARTINNSGIEDLSSNSLSLFAGFSVFP
jgi:hypothetical protein